VHTLVLTVGTGALFAFIGRGSRSEQLARRIGWPGQKEPAGSLVFAVLGILCAWWRNEFWTATAIGAAVWLFASAAPQVRRLPRETRGAGSALFFELTMPVVLLALLIACRLT